MGVFQCLRRREQHAHIDARPARGYKRTPHPAPSSGLLVRKRRRSMGCSLLKQLPRRIIGGTDGIENLHRPPCQGFQQAAVITLGLPGQTDAQLRYLTQLRMAAAQRVQLCLQFTAAYAQLCGQLFPVMPASIAENFKDLTFFLHDLLLSFML